MMGWSARLHHYEGELKAIFPETALVRVLETGTASITSASASMARTMWPAGFRCMKTGA